MQNRGFWDWRVEIGERIRDAGGWRLEADSRDCTLKSAWVRATGRNTRD